MHPTSRVRLDIGGEDPHEHDRITASLGFRLDGSLEVNLVDGFQPSAGSEFLVLDGPVQSGDIEFARVPQLGPGLEWRLDIHAAGVSLLVARRCIADFNADGLVTTGDVVAFLDSWTQTAASTDVNEDGTVDTRDVAQFLNLWVQGC
jgi:hypothetical protein